MCKRHWLEVQKDCLDDGSIADPADLVVLKGLCSTGKRGGHILSFPMMMGVCNEKGKWFTVTKMAVGFDDATLTGFRRN